MDEKLKIEIANSFSQNFEEQNLNLELNQEEFKIFEKGIYAGSMDDKWDIFIIEPFLYFSRSWTGNCIYKIKFKKLQRSILLQKIQITRDSNQYNWSNINSEIARFKQILEIFLKREDLYKDKYFSKPLIKRTIKNYDPSSNCNRSIGFQPISLTLRIYDTINDEGFDQFEITGLDSFKKSVEKLDLNYKLLSLHLSNKKNPKEGTTFYFDGEASQLFGQISILNKKGS